MSGGEAGVDAAELSSVSGERSAAVAEHHRLQPGELWRRLAVPTRIDAWSLTSLQQRLMKPGEALRVPERRKRPVAVAGERAGWKEPG